MESESPIKPHKDQTMGLRSSSREEIQKDYKDSINNTIKQWEPAFLWIMTEYKNIIQKPE